MPKAFNPIAQGCEERATLGHHLHAKPTLKGLQQARLPMQPFQGWTLVRGRPRVARSSQPWAIGWNAFGVWCDRALRIIRNLPLSWFPGLVMGTRENFC